MTSSLDPFRCDDAAYLLGALNHVERRAFEAHLETCAKCRADVAEMRATVNLLRDATVDDAGDVGPIPHSLRPRPIRAADRQRGRRRWLTSFAGAVAAACITALVALLWPSGSEQQAPAVAMHRLRAGLVSATAALVPRSWGTEIDLICHYGANVGRYTVYRLVVQDRIGNTQDLGTWTLAPGGETSYTTGTALPRNDIARVLVTRNDGEPLLQLTP